MPMDCRAAAARVLGEVLAGKSLNQALPLAVEKVDPRDRGLLKQLCYGSLRQAPRLLPVIDGMLEKPLRDKDRDIRGLLLCGLFQLEAMRTPDHAAVSSTVQATRSLKKAWARGMVNALLRRFIRERETLLARLDEAALACHPPWLFEALQRQWPDQAAGIIDTNNAQPPMVLRVNASRISRDAYLHRLAEQGIASRPGTLSAQALYLESPRDVAELPGFANGEVSVQDEAAQMAALLLQAEPGDRVLDACAAPGGKTCHILELQPALGEMVAMDVDAARLERVAENLGRLQLSAELVQGDAEQIADLLADRQFDKILVDAPCTATGVVRRHPDIKLLRRPRDVAVMAGQQLRILDGLWPLLADGGRLLYATCSVLAAENAGVMARFLTGHANARILPLNVAWGEGADHGRQLLPAIDGPDGLFYCLLQKRGTT